ARVPLKTAGKCLAVMKLAARMAEIGNLNAISDAGAGAQLAAAAFRSAALNVRINLLGMENEPEPARILAELDNLQGEAEGVLSSVQESLAKRAGLRA
ncbi:MAG TPA: cyclodeaminase/cyclohydrolase family protein, partial [Anaerolineaceae bacterium]|nr:cyclodeaminase/cyclohydrolase family protein [Anaerolineaceae bacterium]